MYWSSLGGRYDNHLCITSRSMPLFLLKRAYLTPSGIS